MLNVSISTYLVEICNRSEKRLMKGKGIAGCMETQLDHAWSQHDCESRERATISEPRRIERACRGLSDMIA